MHYDEYVSEETSLNCRAQDRVDCLIAAYSERVMHESDNTDSPENLLGGVGVMNYPRLRNTPPRDVKGGKKR